MGMQAGPVFIVVLEYGRLVDNFCFWSLVFFGT